MLRTDDNLSYSVFSVSYDLSSHASKVMTVTTQYQLEPFYGASCIS